MYSQCVTNPYARTKIETMSWLCNGLTSTSMFTGPNYSINETGGDLHVNKCVLWLFKLP